MEKVIRDGKVAVLYSSDYGGAWYNDHHIEELLFHPVLVELIEQGRQKEITNELVTEALGIDFKHYNIRPEDAKDLRIEWVPEGALFRIHEYDGQEFVVLQEETDS